MPSAEQFFLQSPLVQLALASLACLAAFTWSRSRVRRLINKIPGPPSLPLLGNTIELNVSHDGVGWVSIIHTDSSVWERGCRDEKLFDRMNATTRMWGGRKGVAHAWMGTTPYVLLSRPETVEPILSSVRHVDKSSEYHYLQPWLGTGLLTSSGRKWHSRRKTLTPAFHFRILDDFIDVFRDQAAILVEKLDQEVGNTGFNVFPYVTLCTLDIVCETAMGRNVNAQGCSDSEYVAAVYEIGSIVQNRQAKVWMQPDMLFRMHPMHSRHRKCIETLHGFSNKVIRERKAELKAKRASEASAADTEDNFGRKKRLAFLDLLIEASQDGAVLTDEDIREEVDTFMFEGHDTTSAGISWTLYLLGSHPEIQERAYDELSAIFGDSDRGATMKDLQDMKYLECCIKEALRLYPSVPMMARKLNQDVRVADYTVPAGTTAIVMTYMLHRDPEVFPMPEVFKPERFLAENSAGRHPFAYVPFSAGPRNCIGQKFAILEEKSVISSILRRFKITSLDRREDLTLLGELILRPKSGLNVRLEHRDIL